MPKYEDLTIGDLNHPYRSKIEGSEHDKIISDFIEESNNDRELLRTKLSYILENIFIGEDFDIDKNVFKPSEHPKVTHLITQNWAETFNIERADEFKYIKGNYIETKTGAGGAGNHKGSIITLTPVENEKNLD